MAIRESAFETLSRVAGIKDKQARRDALRRVCAEKPALALTIQYAYHPDVQFDLPKGDLPSSMFIRSQMDDYSLYYQNVKKLKHFGTHSPVPRARKLELFCGLCSDVTSGDADILIAMKDKKLPWKTLNKSFCVKAIPELFPAKMVEESSEEESEEVSA